MDLPQLPQTDIATAAHQTPDNRWASGSGDLFLEDAKMVLSWVIPLLTTDEGFNVVSPFTIEDLLTACARILSNTV
jgi:hypothetical protein